MSFHADLHVHSKHSRATSRDLDLEHLAWWAARKGVAVVGTGDCVHPVWLAELKDKLIPSGDGLFRLRPDIEEGLWKTLPPSCRRPVEFMLSTEISTIYKKREKTRKIHHLIYAPDFASVDRLAASLARIGNIASDGRPILGLDSRDLLEVALESGPDSYLVPAHIWTPWFAALGSQSGFDSIAECYGDLADHIFAVETGLSSDPAMNWRISFLDRYRLTSNSDAHSPGKLGREATRFLCEPGYASIRRALETGEGYGGTVEFFPEEGKYHMDGHRACGVRLDPKETLKLDGRCPACGGRVTVGVAHRVEMLADRAEADAVPPATAGEVTSLVPLPEILSEIVGAGVASKAVTQVYDRALQVLGPELSVLGEVPVADIAKAHPLLGEAVERLRGGSVIREAGYDGEYGVIRLFQQDEISRLINGGMLFDVPLERRAKTAGTTAGSAGEGREKPEQAVPAFMPSAAGGLLAALDADQAAAAAMVDGAVVVLAGPGSGKTRMLVHRVAHLVRECGVAAASCLAVTFTRRATEELRARLAALMPDGAADVAVHSFHSLGLAILRADGGRLGLRPGFRIAGRAERVMKLGEAMALADSRAARLADAASVLKRAGSAGAGEAGDALALLRGIGLEENTVDFDDLVCMTVELLEREPEVAARWRQRFGHICADEFQDVDEMQYRLLRLLVGPHGNLCVIGDPNQAIYGFRGADSSCFARFETDFPGSRTLRLKRNYRSTGTIVGAASRLIDAEGQAIAMRPPAEPIALHVAEDERTEAEFVAATIEDLLGGHDMLAANRKAAGARIGTKGGLGFADFAVLYRSDAQSAALRDALGQVGIPFKKSTPAPIVSHAGVAELLKSLAAGESEAGGQDLIERIAAAAARARAGGADTAVIAEAERWMAALAETAGGDAGRLGEQVALATEADFWDARADRVSLMTMHAAKGLEFAVVFVVGLEDGIMPFRWDMEAGGIDQEERRLFYVAMTRAKDRLFLTRALQRFRHGEVRNAPPSRFLADLGQEFAAPYRPAGLRRRRPQQYKLF